MSDKLALVLAGGGARAAYQAGVLARIAEEFPAIEFPILTGVSAGAINAAYLANSLDSFSDTVQRLVDLWSRLEMERGGANRLIDRIEQVTTLQINRVKHRSSRVRAQLKRSSTC